MQLTAANRSKPDRFLRIPSGVRWVDVGGDGGTAEGEGRWAKRQGGITSRGVVSP